MALVAGSRLGPYEIAAPLGAGGMGEVYRARDPRLGRDVALKVLPAGFSDDADRLRRFEQEARAAGLLNHPGITAVFDTGSQDGVTYVVSELLEGETLRARLAAGALPVRKALEYARQIAHGLAAAHEKGIVHRDLKPENLFVTSDGRVKILDFGLAKVTDADHPAATNSPTATAGTEPGMLLGTIGYMSPEQVRGKPADHRSDIFSFGAILHEMLSGKRAFHGDSAADTMSAILKEEPEELSTLNTRMPPGLERIVRHCLEKSPGERFHSAHDLAFQLEAISNDSGSIPGTTVAARSRVSWKSALASLLLVAVGALAGGLLTTRFHSADIPDAPTFRYLTYSGDDWGPAVSPDGRLVAFGSTRDGRTRIWLKELAGGNEVPLTAGQDFAARFSPDGSTLYFARDIGTRNDLYRIPVVGGEPRKVLEEVADVADPSPDGRSLAFLRHGKASNDAPWEVWLANADGGGARLLTRLPPSGDAASLRWSPDGRRLAVVLQDPGASLSPVGLVLVDAASGEQQALAPVSRRGLIGRLAWEPGGRALLYTHNEQVSVSDLSGMGRLIRQDVDSHTFRSLASFPRSLGIGDLAALGSGRLVLDSDASRQSLHELELQRPGGPQGRFLTRGNGVDRQPTYSPDGQRIVFSALRGDNYDLWEISRPSGSLRRLTDHPGHDWDPAFTPDGTKLIWSSDRTGHFEIWLADADGGAARQLSSDGVDAQNPTATPDGSWIVYGSENPARPGLWKIRSDGSQATRLVEGEVIHPEVSPDGRYALWFSTTPGEGRTLHVRGLADGVATGCEIKGLSHRRGRWLPDGKRIAFVDRPRDGEGGVYVQDFTLGRDTRSTRRLLVRAGPGLEIESFGISPDGSRVTLSRSSMDRRSC